MYGIVLMALVATGGNSTALFKHHGHCGKGGCAEVGHGTPTNAPPGNPNVPGMVAGPIYPYYACCGHVTMFWDGCRYVPPAMEHEWLSYANCLEDWERHEMLYVWHRATPEGRYKLLAMLKELRFKAMILKAEMDQEKEDKEMSERKELPPPSAEKKDMGKGASAGGLPATIVVTLPATAKLTVNGRATTGTGAERKLSSPPLEPGKEYEYQLEASFEQGGEPATVKKTIKIRSGEETRVSMTAPDKN